MFGFIFITGFCSGICFRSKAKVIFLICFNLVVQCYIWNCYGNINFILVNSVLLFFWFFFLQIHIGCCVEWDTIPDQGDTLYVYQFESSNDTFICTHLYSLFFSFCCTKKACIHFYQKINLCLDLIGLKLEFNYNVQKA